MKKIYWSAVQFRPFAMVLVATISLGCMCWVESFKELVPEDHYQLKYEAASLAEKAFHAIKERRLALGYKIDTSYDLTGSGMLGVKSSTITSDHGVLRSKQMGTNPNFAALIIQWLSELKLKKGDYVAVGMTGSFPGIDISMLSAIQVLGLKPIIVLSGAASNWGANLPKFNIIDQISYLFDQKILLTAPIAASIGASYDLGKYLGASGIKDIENSIKRNNLTFIHERTIDKSINKRLQLYSEMAGLNEVKAYINVGGGVSSIGKHVTKKHLSKETEDRIRTTNLRPGVNTVLPLALANTNSVAVRYLKLGIPVINFKSLDSLAEKYDMEPRHTPAIVGVGSLFFHKEYNILYAIISLLIITAICYGEMRIQRRLRRQEAAEQLI